MTRKKQETPNSSVTMRPNDNLGYKRRIRTLLFRSLVIGVLLGGAILISQLKVQGVVVQGYKEPERIVQAAQFEMEKSFLWSNLLFLSSDALAQALEANPSIQAEDISVKKNWLKRYVEIRAAERIPKFLWETVGQVYTVDGRGRIITSKPDNTKELPLVVDASNLPVEEDQQVAPASFVNFASRVAGEIATQTSLTPRNIIVEESISEAVVATEENISLRFATTEDVGNQIENVRLTLEHAKSLNEAVASYIDVRIPYKAYYR